ncbi:MAG TPA: 30S ribosomal protein S19, partial [Candidatus Nitrosotenuis sp.]|nr:30S ribosomal protein S19 [Candidatus Nitrosotenuis sp.]
MVKEFDYRGIPLDQLQNMSLEKLFEIFPARARRS